MRKCGFHAQRTSNELREAILAVEPTMCVSLAHDRDFWLEIKQLLPDTLLIGRLYEAGRDWRQQSPEEWAELCAAQNMPYDAWITWNEPHGINNQVTPEDAALYDDFCCRFRARALELGFEAMGPNVAAGNWHGDAVVRHMPRWCQQAKYISRHEYSARAMWDQAPALERPPSEVPLNDGDQRGWWYTLTYRAWYDAIIAAYPQREGQFEIPITEGGVAYGVIPDAEGRPKYGDVGWKTDMSEEDYVNSLKWYTGELNEDAYCTGWAIFMTGADDPFWDSFETLPLAHRLLEIPEIPETPEPPPEEEMDIRVIDLNYQERDFQYAEDKYGVAFRRAEVEPGQLVWRLIELWEATGHHSLITQVLDEDGQPVENATVTFYWPDAPDPPDPPTTVYPHDWYRNFVHGPTNVNGDVGPGMGSGAWIDVDPNPPHNAIGGGPHAVWIHDANIPSDICEKLGMRGGTNHDHLDQKFRLMRAGENGNGNGDVVLRLKETLVEDYHEAALAIAYPASVAVDTRGDGRGPGFDVDIHPKSWEHPTLGAMAMVEMCCDFDGTEPRTYTLRVYRMSDGASLTNTEAESFQPLGFPRKRVIYVYEIGTEPEPPINGDLLAAVLRMEKHLAAIWEKYVEDGEEPPPPEPEMFDVKFFNNMELTDPPAHTMKEAPPFQHDWGLGSPVPGVVNEDYISGRWTGSFTFKSSTYRFSVRTDDGVRLWVDGAKVIDEWFDQAPHNYYVDVALTAGKHDILVDWYERAGGATFHFSWSPVSRLAMWLQTMFGWRR